MEVALGFIFVVAMIVASKGIKAPTNAAHVVRLHNGESSLSSGNFWLALGLLAIVAVIGIGIVGAGGSTGATNNTQTGAAHVDSWSNNQVNIASEVRNTVIGSDGTRLCEDAATGIWSAAAW